MNNKIITGYNIYDVLYIEDEIEIKISMKRLLHSPIVCQNLNKEFDITSYRKVVVNKNKILYNKKINNIDNKVKDTLYKIRSYSKNSIQINSENISKKRKFSSL
jgi:hypothetical protein